MRNTVKEKMSRGEKVIGTFSVLGSASVMECLGMSGLDYAIIDGEHGPFTEESVQDFIRAAKLRKLSPFVRIREISRAAVLRMLDLGADALVVPNVRSLDEVERLAEYGKFPPAGKRGFGLVRATGYGREPFAQDIGAYFALANRETLLIPQCETVECLEQIEAVAALAGVDGVFVGPFDLSIAMGMPARFDAPEFQQALGRILAACKSAGKFCLIFATDPAGAAKAFAAGFDGVAFGTDAQVLMQGFGRIVAELRPGKGA